MALRTAPGCRSRKGTVNAPLPQVIALAEGTLFVDRYRIVRCIGYGETDAVYEAVHVGTDRRCAVKLMLPDLIQSEELRGRFRQEARAAAQVECDHSVNVLDAGIDEVTEAPFLVMELLRGEELEARLRRVGRFAPEEVVVYLQQAALGLDRIHRASIVHRDLEPGNLFLAEYDDGSPRIKLLDCGVAKLLVEVASGGAPTRGGGAPLYKAPEQLQGQAVSAATDIYALGMVAFTLLVGTAYWSEEATRDTGGATFAERATRGPCEPATTRAARRGVVLPPAFDLWFSRATAVSPADRFRTASEAVEALAPALSVTLPQRQHA